MTMAEPIPPRFLANPHGRLVEAALAEWANLIREFYLPREGKQIPDIREVYEPSSTHRTPRATNEQSNPVLAALIRDENAGRWMARTVHDFLMPRDRRGLAYLLWLQQDGNTHEEIGKAVKLRKCLVGTALNLAKIDLGIYLVVCLRNRGKRDA